VFDDLLEDLIREPVIANWYTKYSHHRSTTVFTLIQNLLPKGPHPRTCSLNSCLILSFRNVRDQGQIQVIGRQMNMNKKNNLIEKAYELATAEPFGYLVIDMRPKVPNKYRFRNSIFALDENFTVYSL
jgi:hypothetical protein